MGRTKSRQHLRTAADQAPRLARLSSAHSDPKVSTTTQTRTLAHSLVSVSEESDPWLTLQQSAAIVQTHEATLRREIRSGRLRSARVGGRRSIRLRRSWL